MEDGRGGTVPVRLRELRLRLGSPDLTLVVEVDSTTWAQLRDEGTWGLTDDAIRASPANFAFRASAPIELTLVAPSALASAGSLDLAGLAARWVERFTRPASGASPRGLRCTGAHQVLPGASSRAKCGFQLRPG